MKRLIWILAATAVLADAQDRQPAANTNVEMTVYLISGSAQGTTDDVPKDLESTVKQLHSVFAYKSYKLSESFILRGRSGYASTEGVLPGVGLRYRFGYGRLLLSGDAPRAVQLDGLYLELTKPVSGFTDGNGKEHYQTVAKISTNLDMRDGQKIVVGKSSLNSVGDALILVIVPKIVD
jgi:hypothetical protein